MNTQFNFKGQLMKEVHTELEVIIKYNPGLKKVVELLSILYEVGEPVNKPQTFVEIVRKAQHRVN